MRIRVAAIAFVAANALACAAGPSRDAVSWISEATRVNREANEAVARGDREAAYAALVQFVQHPDVPRPDVGRLDARGDKRIVLMDVYFRLAEMALAARNAPAALLWSSRGLALGAANDVFSANLLIAKGHAAAALGDDGLAGESFHKALVINEALLAVALGESAQ